MGEQTGRVADRSLPYPHLLSTWSPLLTSPLVLIPPHSSYPHPDPARGAGGATTRPGTWLKNPQGPIQSWEAPATKTPSSINNLPGWQVSREMAWLVAETDGRSSRDSIRFPTPNLPHAACHLGVDRTSPKSQERSQGSSHPFLCLLMGQHLSPLKGLGSLLSLKAQALPRGPQRGWTWWS